MAMQPGVFINNEFRGGSGPQLASVNPATDEVLWQGKGADGKNVDDAIASAREAFPSWSILPIDGRKAHLLKFAETVEKKKKGLAETISQETGKPLWESMGEAAALASKVGLTIDSYNERRAMQSEAMGEAMRTTQYKPHGTVAVFGPFNLPMHLPNGHILPALLAGNTVVFKPSEQTPLSGQLYMDCWKAVGLPDGVLSMVQGARETGMALAGHAGIDGLFFTGSFQVGSAIHKSWAGQPEKILALEMGGNNPLIIDQIKDIPAACYMAIESAFITAGQRCVCARRLIVVEDKKTDRLLSHLVEMTKAIVVGKYDQKPQPFIGPLISKDAAKEALRAQKNLIRQGGKALLEGACIDGKAMLSPGIIDMTSVAKRDDGEIFGPILQVIRVKTLDEAIDEANQTDYGLAAGILSDRRESFDRFYRLSRSGIVNWNRPTTGSSSKGPFGGIGKSGNFHPCAYFASDYCSYPVATIEMSRLKLPDTLTEGIQV